MQVERVPTLAGRGSTKVYRTGDVEINALWGVDVDLYAGELVVLVGASGSGKSTLLNIIGGLDFPRPVVFRSAVNCCPATAAQ